VPRSARRGRRRAMAARSAAGSDPSQTLTSRSTSVSTPPVATTIAVRQRRIPAPQARFTATLLPPVRAGGGLVVTSRSDPDYPRPLPDLHRPSPGLAERHTTGVSLIASYGRFHGPVRLAENCVTIRLLKRTLVREAQMTTQLWNPESRLTPWALLDLERIAWVAELRANELTDEERQILRNVAQRLQHVADPPEG